MQYALGRGPKMKNGRIDKKLKIQLGLYIRKPGKKSLTQKKLILIRGFAFEKNGPCSRENEVPHDPILANLGVPEMALRVPKSKF